ncbi:MAG: hypothetical protein PHP92_03320 [Candidatus Nanoarchaeia archaeon]|nr:hypothetical protein [Candidatus Nanoarchaeia archaeon]
MKKENEVYILQEDILNGIHSMQSIIYILKDCETLEMSKKYVINHLEKNKIPHKILINDDKNFHYSIPSHPDDTFGFTIYGKIGLAKIL